MQNLIDHPAIKAAMHDVATEWCGSDFVSHKSLRLLASKYLAPALEQLVAEEREACAKIAEEASHDECSTEQWDNGFATAADEITAAIRERGTP